MTEVTRSRRLRDLARAAGDLLVEAPPDLNITGLAHDSRAVQPGDLFFCVPGLKRDGHDFAAGALAAGAGALVVEHPLDVGPEVVVSDARRAAGRIAAEFYGRPATDLLLLGVTGTNGKTTTTFLLDAILAAAGHVTGLIGTVETRVAGERRAGVRTTPDAIDLQRLLAEMVASKVSAVAMEVTSHGLVLHRVEGLRFAAAGFTNLSQDHLDFHASMEDYFAAKRSLFTPERIDAGAANVDDPYGRQVRGASGVPTVGFGVAEDAEIRAEHPRMGPWGLEFVARTPAGELAIKSSLVGGFNLSNCLGAIAISLQAGIAPAAIENGLASLRAVPGRFEAVDAGQPFAVVVDYAHTPDSLDNVLREARRMAGREDGRVLCVFGCGGDRDRGKRPLMGAVAARNSDIVIVTSDNPRSENPEAIVAEILPGVLAERPSGPEHVLTDRHEAIATALREAGPGDVVVIAGKGHETGQEFADRTVPFDDREVARAVLIAEGLGS